MNNFRTTVSVTPSESKIDQKTAVLTVGSCFSDVVGLNLQRYKIPVSMNPFGVIYNPYSIHNALRYAILNQNPDDSLYTRHGDIHVNYDFHSEFSAMSKQELATRLSNTIGDAHLFLKRADCIIITYGTAWVYQLKNDGRTVANCHKMAANLFEKKLMKEEEIVQSFQEFYQALKVINNNVRIILTVSPVRHIKDTLELNNVSKSMLRIATHEIVNTFNEVEYFPSFEIMMDDLRDYRFYKSDMIHPSADAEKYIWEKFSDRYFSDETRKVLSEFDKVLAAMAHKPFHPTSAAHQQFLKETLRKLENLKGKIDVDKEIELLQKQII